MGSQLTLRGFDPALEQQIHKTAAEKGISLNKAALLLMRKGAGIAEPGAGIVASRLQKYTGSWTEEEEAQFRQAVSAFDEVDESFWR